MAPPELHPCLKRSQMACPPVGSPPAALPADYPADGPSVAPVDGTVQKCPAARQPEEPRRRRTGVVRRGAGDEGNEADGIFQQSLPVTERLAPAIRLLEGVTAELQQGGRQVTDAGNRASRDRVMVLYTSEGELLTQLEGGIARLFAVDPALVRRLVAMARWAVAEEAWLVVEGLVGMVAAGNEAASDRLAVVRFLQGWNGRLWGSSFRVLETGSLFLTRELNIEFSETAAVSPRGQVILKEQSHDRDSGGRPNWSVGLGAEGLAASGELDGLAELSLSVGPFHGSLPFYSVRDGRLFDLDRLARVGYRGLGVALVNGEASFMMGGVFVNAETGAVSVPAGWFIAPLVAIGVISDVPSLERAALDPGMALTAAVAKQVTRFLAVPTWRDLAAVIDSATPPSSSGPGLAVTEFDRSVATAEGFLRQGEYNLALSALAGPLADSAGDPLLAPPLQLLSDRAHEQEMIRSEGEEEVRRRVLTALQTVEAGLARLESGETLTSAERELILGAVSYLAAKMVLEVNGEEIVRSSPAHLQTAGEYRRLFQILARVGGGVLDQLLAGGFGDYPATARRDRYATFVIRFASVLAEARASLPHFVDWVQGQVVQGKLAGSPEELRPLAGLRARIVAGFGHNLDTLGRMLPTAEEQRGLRQAGDLLELALTPPPEFEGHDPLGHFVASAYDPAALDPFHYTPLVRVINRLNWLRSLPSYQEDPSFREGVDQLAARLEDYLASDHEARYRIDHDRRLYFRSFAGLERQAVSAHREALEAVSLMRERISSLAPSLASFSLAPDHPERAHLLPLQEELQGVVSELRSLTRDLERTIGAGEELFLFTGGGDPELFRELGHRIMGHLVRGAVMREQEGALETLVARGELDRATGMRLREVVAQVRIKDEEAVRALLDEHPHPVSFRRYADTHPGFWRGAVAFRSELWDFLAHQAGGEWAPAIRTVEGEMRRENPLDRLLRRYGELRLAEHHGTLVGPMRSLLVREERLALLQQRIEVASQAVARLADAYPDEDFSPLSGWLEEVEEGLTRLLQSGEGLVGALASWRDSSGRATAAINEWEEAFYYLRHFNRSRGPRDLLVRPPRDFGGF